LKSDARDADCRVDDEESCARGWQAVAAVKNGGGRHAADDEGPNAADADGGLAEGTSAQGHERSAHVIDSVGDGFARLCHAAAARGRVSAGCWVDGD